MAGANFLWGYDINNNGDILGIYQQNSGQFLTKSALISTDGTVSVFPSPVSLRLSKINDLGLGVGSIFLDHDSIEQGVAYDNGSVINLVYPGSTASGALGVNNRGQVVGFFAEGQAPAVPEPSFWAMMIAGFGMVGSTLRRRNQLAPAL